MQEEFEHALTLPGVCLALIHREGIVMAVSTAVERDLGYSAESLVGAHFAALLPNMAPAVDGIRDDSGRVRIGEGLTGEIPSANGEIRKVEVQIGAQHSKVLDQSVIVVTFRTLERGTVPDPVDPRGAGRDPVTALPAVPTLMSHLSRWLDVRSRGSAQCAVIAFDIQDFQSINADFGRAFGDALLEAVALRARNGLRSEDLVVRDHSDEFLVFMPNVGAGRDLKAVVARFHASLNGNYHLNGRTVAVRFALGVAMAPQDGNTADSMLESAQQALRVAKQRAMRWPVYCESLGLGVVSGVRDLRRLLRGGPTRGDLLMVAQPIVGLNGAVSLVGAEALLRWRRGPDMAYESVGPYLGMMQSQKDLSALDAWVAKTGAEAVRSLEMVRAGRVLNLNATGQNLPALAKLLMERLAGDLTGICVELTEHRLVQCNQSSVRALQSIRDHGGLVALDDFGTGYSSLAYLQSLPLDEIKVDRAFTARLDSPDGVIRQQGRGLLRTIKFLADTLKLRLIVEGVETVEQLRVLQDFEIHYAQGFLFGAAQPIAEFCEWQKGAAFGDTVQAAFAGDRQPRPAA